MRCPFCRKNVIGERNIVVVAGEGPAHKLCYEREVVGQRVFGGIHLPSLNMNQLNELKEMLLTEINSRHIDDDDAVELFG